MKVCDLVKIGNIVRPDYHALFIKKHYGKIGIIVSRESRYGIKRYRVLFGNDLVLVWMADLEVISESR
jgi:hypothetical protein